MRTEGRPRRERKGGGERGGKGGRNAEGMCLYNWGCPWHSHSSFQGFLVGRPREIVWLAKSDMLARPQHMENRKSLHTKHIRYSDLIAFGQGLHRSKHSHIVQI